MFIKTGSLWALSSLAALGLAGCVVSGTVQEHRTYYEPSPRAIVVQEPRPVIIRRAPPAPIVEVVPARPSSEVIWVPGYYEPRGEEWIWVRGEYRRPPHSGAVWVPPRHNRHSNGEVEVTLGFWR